MKSSKNNAGFVALITAIVLTVVLLLIATTLNLSGFFTRSSAMSAEYKERSASAAEACADRAMLKLAGNPAYAGGETISLGTDSCEIRPILPDSPSAGKTTIETRAVFNESATNLRIVIVNSDKSVISWDEIENF